ncbi:hypothetical protein BGZ47_006138 [Haplosporangium gracile]|nr:hypothetical protein BGZ47_006138 [Haplosporangium gracile]
MSKESHPTPSGPSPHNSRSGPNSALVSRDRAANKAVESSSSRPDRFISHEVSDADNEVVSSQPVRKQSKFFGFFRSSNSSPKVKVLPSSKPKESVNRLSTSSTPATPHRISTASTQYTADIENEASGTVKIEHAFSGTAVKSPSSDVQPSTLPAEPRLDVFLQNFNKPAIVIPLPEFGARIDATPQLALCIGLLLKDSDALGHKEDLSLQYMSFGTADQLAWLKNTKQDPTEQERLHWLINRIVEEFAKDAFKNSTEIAEIVLLGPVLDSEYYRRLLSCTITAFDQNVLLDVDLLQGLVQLTQSGPRGSLVSDDLVKVLSVLRVRLQRTHQQSSEHLFHLTLAVSRLLDVMADHKIEDLNRVEEHEPLSGVLSGLKDSSNPYLMYQACYAFQALQYVPSKETPLQAVLRHSTGVADGLVKVTAVFKLDLGAVLEGLGKLQEAFGSTVGAAVTVYKGESSLMESGQGVLDALRERFGSGQRQPWYAAIRAAQVFVHSGQLRDLNQLVREAPCRRDPLFQWGICQLLGEIASDNIWTTTVRQQAVDLLEYLYKHDAEWGQDESVKTWMLNIMRQLATISDQAISTSAHTVLKDLNQDQGITTSLPYPLRNRLPLPSCSPTLTRVLRIPDVEYSLHKLRQQRLEEHRKGVYIPPQAKASLQTLDDSLFSLIEKVQEFLAGQKQVFLVLGDSGAGKTTFNLELEHTLWKSYKKYEPIPLYINLPTIDDPEHDLIEKQLQDHNFSEDQIHEMKLHRKFILICDGYDESQLKTNIHTANQFNQSGQWQVKIVISCRTQYLGRDYRSRFQPQPQPVDRCQRTTMDLFQEAVVAAFSRAQIQQYVNEYIKKLPAFDPVQKTPSWTAEEYMDKLVNIPNLMDLVSNPFLLKLTLDALPAVIKSKTNLSAIRVTRVQLYDSFVTRWLEVNRTRLEASPLSDEEQAELGMLIDDNFIYHGIHYQKDLATTIFIDHGGNPIVKYIHLRDKGTWKARFFAPNGQAKLLRESSTITRSGAFFRFLHRSLLEYFYSRTIYDPLDSDSEVDDSGGREPAFDLKTCLAQKNLNEEPSIVQFLAERVPQDPSFRQQLLDMVDESKADEVDVEIKVAAANAFTILVKAGVTFHGANLRGVKIPRADLSGGQFDYAQFQGADLTRVNLAGSWLRQANLSNAQMEGVRFGELSYVETDGSATACAYSPDGKILAAGLDEGGLEIYDTNTWRRIYRCLVDHPVLSVAFSPDSRRIVSGSEDGKVRLWDCTNGEKIFVMEGHLRSVNCVAFSPCGKQIASASADETVRLWNSKTGKCTFVLKGHTNWVKSVQYSPDGRRLVSGGIDEKIRFWDPETGEPGAVWISSLGTVFSLAFSRDGRWIASAHERGRLQCWHAVSGELGPVLRGHTGTVKDVTFSPDSRWIASSSNDVTMRLWDASAGTLAFMSSSHKAPVYNVTFSPDGRQIASGGRDRKVRLWEVDSVLSSGIAVHNQLGPVVKTVYSPNGQAILTASGEQTVKQWDSLTGAPVPLPIRLPESLLVDSVAYCLDGIPVIFSTQDGTTRLLQLQEGGAETVMEGSSTMRRVVMSPSCRFIASLDLNDTVELWELGVTQHKCVLLQKGGTTGETIGCLAFSTTGDRLAVGSWSGIVWIFESRLGSLVISKKLTNQEVSTMSFSPNGLQLAIGTVESSIYLWDLQSEECAVELKEHTECVTCVAYSPCGQWIASSSMDKTVRLWSRQQPPSETESWSCIHTVQDFFRHVLTTAWSPTVPMEFVTGCWDESVRVWRVSGKGEDVVVKLVWGTNLAILHAPGLVLKDVAGLSSTYRRLLVQRGAIDEFLPLERAGGLEVEK